MFWRIASSGAWNALFTGNLEELQSSTIQKFEVCTFSRLHMHLGLKYALTVGYNLVRHSSRMLTLIDLRTEDWFDSSIWINLSSLVYLTFNFATTQTRFHVCISGTDLRFVGKGCHEIVSCDESDAIDFSKHVLHRQRENIYNGKKQLIFTDAACLPSLKRAFAIWCAWKSAYQFGSECRVSHDKGRLH